MINPGKISRLGFVLMMYNIAKLPGAWIKYYNVWSSLYHQSVQAITLP
jgi:hypothetical protein